MFLFFAFVCCLFARVFCKPDLRAFDKYVSSPDPHYKWELIETTAIPERSITVYLLNLTSQKWLDDSWCTPSIWTHFLAVIVPDDIPADSSLGFLWITNGNTGERPSPKSNGEINLISTFVSLMSRPIISAVLFQIPNQPLYFQHETPKPTPRFEDAAIAFTWWDFIHTEGRVPDYLLRFPMVKGAIRALDTVETFVTQHGKTKWGEVSEWIVGGASKRGWTTWMVGAYDAAHEKRVKAIMPVVESMLNMTAQFHVWWKMLGGWSFALRDYYELDLFTDIGEDRFPSLAYQIDPFEYNERFHSLDVFELFGTQDEFFTGLDPWQYWKELTFKSKHLAFVPNADHDLEKNLEYLRMIVPPFLSWYADPVSKSKSMPSVQWSREPKSNSLLMVTSTTPSSVKLWKGISIVDRDIRMDFRLITLDDPCPGVVVRDICMCDVKFEAESVHVGKDQTKFDVVIPVDGNGKSIMAFFEVRFDGGGGVGSKELIFTSAPIIVPYVFPFEDCVKGEACRGKLV